MLLGKEKNIEHLRAICTGCGTCAGICPTNAIEMSKSHVGYNPFIKRLKCTNCGLCLQACPGYNRNLEELSKYVFGKTPQDMLLGNYIDCYVGHSSDRKIRYSATSGGIATTLLIFALNEGVIDGAIVTKMDENNPFEPKAFLAQNEEEVIAASKSKYCPVPVNVVIKDVLSKNGKFAIVGLPCHIHGIRRAEIINKELRDKLILHIGLFCVHNISFLGTKFLLQRMKITAQNVVGIEYRGKGWPGGMTIQLRGDREIFLPHQFHWDHFFTSFFFTPLYCTLCTDGLNELADISLGDAWLRELVGRSIGDSIIITRTEVGEEIVQRATSRKKVKAKRIARKRVVRAHRGKLIFKKKKLKARMSMLKWFVGPLPEIDLTRYPKNDFKAYLGAILTYLNIYLSSKKELSWLLRFIPLKLFRRYARVMRKLTLRG